MSRNKSLGLLAGAALCMVSSAGLAQDADRAYRSELLADAAGRSSLLAAGGSVHHDNGAFGVSDGSGNNSLNVNLFTQYRHMFNFSDQPDSDGDEADLTHGGQLARVRVILFGTVGSPNMEYFIQFGADPVSSGFSDDSNGSSSDSHFASGEVAILDALFTYWFDEPGNGVYARFGGGRPSQGFEQMTHIWQQQFMERSIPGVYLSPGRQQFFGGGYQDDAFDIEIFFTDGAFTSNTDFTSSIESDFGIGGRANFIINGSRDAFANQSSFPGSPDGFRAGLGGQYQTGGDTGIATMDLDLWFASADVELRGSGYSVRVHGYVQSVEFDGSDEITNFGVAVRGGVFLDDNWEIFAGWDALFLDDELGLEEDNQNFIRAGVNFFPFAQSTAVRFTGEVILALDETSDVISGTGSLGSEFGSMLSTTRQNILGDDDTEFGVGFQAAVLN